MSIGRPTKYKPEYIKTARALAKLGATNAEMAEAFGVSLSTFNLWKVQHEAFSDAIKIGKDVADARVVDALYHRAMGFSHVDTDIRVVDGAIVETPIVKHYAPDTTAAIFWLKNRRPDEWRDKQELEHSGNIALTDRILAARKRANTED
ncbi:terminase [Pseudomonas aeruginosa]|uniref:terminase n=1 Tax=Pseudomonas aeruginosa TaxID=287 RepID=UPI0020445E35|nr:terminase [Pseudomonas aeruginosa]EKD5498886.1 terminase [Pseudomonas aeruginosa]EKD5528591.1 terminase [Pseudomonas aeruginosa]EKF8170775.1 terminase [Pseudomonas aeruginosa]EKF8186581.1 terminase [Pseudomonas aeruginosa]EKU7349528.1 terminase [Pseudomonas aeruginosa]